MTPKQQHKSSVDWLRIIAMILIIAHHISVHGILAADPAKKSLFTSIFILGGKTGVNIFLLITGYFSFMKSSFRPAKVGRLALKCSIYALVFALLMILLGVYPWNGVLLLKAFLPLIMGGGYWFMVIYLEIYLLIPVLNLAVEKLERRTYFYYLAGGTFIFCILPTFAGAFIEISNYGFSELVWLIYVYYVGAYLGKYVDVEKEAGKWLTLGFLSISILLHILCAVLVAKETTLPVVLDKLISSLARYDLNSFFPAVIAFLFFVLFMKIDQKENRWIRALGASTLGIYLFHDNLFFKNYMWTVIFKMPEMVESRFIFLYGLAVIGIIFLVGFIMDYIVEHLINIFIK